MRYKLLGNSGLKVSQLCLGTMTFGEDWGWGSSKDESRDIYNAFRDAGGNFIDTANVYTNGSSEKFLGDLMKDHRQQVVLATKYTNAMPGGKDPNVAGNHRKSMMQAVEASLKRLQTDYIDLYWLHIWDSFTPIEEVMRGFEDLVRQGKILYAGISDTPAWIIARGNTIAEFRGWTPFIGLQIEYSLLERTPERELIPMAAALGIGVTAWSPLKSGVLTGKYQSGTMETGSRLANAELSAALGADHRSAAGVVTAVQEVAGEIGASAAQVSLAWLLHRSHPVIPIIGARRLSQFRDNLGSVDVKLTPEQARRLDEASKFDAGFPHNFLEREMVRNLSSGGFHTQIDRN